jgi:hypothetical protein
MKSLGLGLLKNGAAIAIAFFVMSAPAQAVYKYEYNGNVFPTTEWFYYYNPDEPPPFYPYYITYDSKVTAEVFSPTLLTSGSGFTNGLTFTLTQTSSDYAMYTMTYPYPFPPYYNYHEEGVFNIGAVDASGLPTKWDISINYASQATTGRVFSRTFTTSTDLDSVTGGYEGFHYFEGSNANNPGTWTVSAVPEPGIYAMLLAGLGLIGFSARKHS